MTKMKPCFLLLLAVFCFSQLWSQIANDETTITLSSVPPPSPQAFCPGFNPPSGSYTLRVQYEDLDNGGTQTTVSNLSCTVTNNGSQIVISVPGANFPTLANTIYPYDFPSTNGNLTLTGSSGTYTTMWAQTQYVCGALPITLTYFHATAIYYYVNSVKYGKVLTEWQTASESNSSFFEVQRSSDAINFSVVGTVQTQAPDGMSSSTLNYHYTDYYPLSGRTYYRLRCVDRDGSSKYSEVRSVVMSGFSTRGPVLVDCSNITIQGQSTICDNPSTAAYTLSSLPTDCNNVTWSLTPSNLGQVSSTSLAHATVSKSYNGVVTLQATVEGCTNATKNRTKTIQFGQPYVSVHTDNYYTNYSYTTYNFSAQDPYGNYVYVDWYVNDVYVTSGTAYSLNTYAYNYNCDLVKIVYHGPCNNQEAYLNACYQTPGGGGGGGGCDPVSYYTVSPVPSGDVMTVSPNRYPPPCYPAYAAKSNEVYTLQLYDMYGNLKKEKRNVSLKTPQQLSVRDLPEGNYVLNLIGKDNQIIRKQVKIQR